MAATIVGADVDWISSVCPLDSPLYSKCSDLALNIISDQEALGDVTHSQMLYGYGGMKSGKVFFGTRTDSAIVQCSGDAARKYWRAIAEAFPRTSRLDIAIDVRLESADTDYIRFAARDSAEHRTTSRNPWKIRFIDGHGAGDTAYFGSFNSDHFMRIYDKYAESGDEKYKNTIRYEVVLRRENATNYSKRLLESTGAAQVRYMEKIVNSYCAARGINCLFTTNSTVNLHRLGNGGHDKERFEKWILKQMPTSINRAIGWEMGPQLAKVLPLCELLHACNAPKELIYSLRVFLMTLRKDT